MKKIISIALSMVLLVAISIPVISISVNLGEKGASGTWVSVPTTTSYYELYVSKVIEVRPYITYRARPGTDDWEFVSAGVVNMPYSVTAYARKV